MAIYHLQVQSISRAAGRSATGAAAYRAGERLRDERTGVLHNHSGRRDVSHKEIVPPPQLDAPGLAWAADRASLWNAAERAETRRNARVAHEYQRMRREALQPAGAQPEAEHARAAGADLAL